MARSLQTATRQLPVGIFLIVPRGTLLFIECVNEMLVTTEEDVQRGESSKPGAADGPLLAVIHILFAGDFRRGTEASTRWNNIWPIYSQSIRR